MGLLTDIQGITIPYDLFRGNMNGCEILMPILDKVKKEYQIGRTIVVADKRVNTTDNITFSLTRGDGYIYSQTIRGANRELKDYVLDLSRCWQFDDDCKIKSRLYPLVIAVSKAKGGRSKVHIDEKKAVFYSAEYDSKVKVDSKPALMKARELINNPSKYNKTISYYVYNVIRISYYFGKIS